MTRAYYVEGIVVVHSPDHKLIAIQLSEDLSEGLALLLVNAEIDGTSSGLGSGRHG